jgi:hypothetical protein
MIFIHTHMGINDDYISIIYVLYICMYIYIYIFDQFRQSNEIGIFISELYSTSPEPGWMPTELDGLDQAPLIPDINGRWKGWI